MHDLFCENGNITLGGVERFEAVRLCRATRLADATLAIAGGTACRRADCTWLNVAAGMGLRTDVSRDDIDALAAWYDELGVGSRVEIPDRAHPSLIEHLGRAGYRLRSLVAVLARNASPPLPPEPLPPGLEIRRLSAQDIAACEEVATALTTSFVAPGTTPSPGDIRANTEGLAHPEAYAFGAYVDGRCAGGGVLDVRADVACLWGAAVVPEFRRRGIQRAMIVHRMLIAAEAGARTIVIEATAGGPTHRNAERLGFRLAYTRAMVFREGSR